MSQSAPGTSAAAALFGRDDCFTLADMLLAKPYRIATTQAGIGQHIKPYSLLGPGRPVLLVGGDIDISPNREALAGSERRVFHGGRRVMPDEPGFLGPRIDAAHGGVLPRLSLPAAMWASVMAV